jgi:hypothetical protein
LICPISLGVDLVTNWGKETMKPCWVTPIWWG